MLKIWNFFFSQNGSSAVFRYTSILYFHDQHKLMSIACEFSAVKSANGEEYHINPA